MEFGETVLAHLPEVGKGSGNPAPKLVDRYFVRTDDGVVYARSEENLKAVIETPQKPRSTSTDDAADPRVVPEVQEHENQNEERER